MPIDEQAEVPLRRGPAEVPQYVAFREIQGTAHPLPSIIVAGITNLETSLKVEEFPIVYAKSRFAFHGVRDRPGGVGYNVARALAHLGAPVEFCTLLGRDMLGEMLQRHLREIEGLGCGGVLREQDATLRSTILVENTGRAAMFTDLKDSQEITYPGEAFDEVLKSAEIVHATNINWSLDLAQRARRAGMLVSTDVQAIRHVDEPYNRRFLDVADIVFFSGENLEMSPHVAIEALWQDSDVRLAICTLAERGALLGERDSGEIIHQPAVPLRQARNVTGAGDAFAAGFLASYQAGLSPVDAMLRAQLVAGYRIGEEGSGHGLPPLAVLNAEFQKRREEWA